MSFHIVLRQSRPSLLSANFIASNPLSFSCPNQTGREERNDFLVITPRRAVPCQTREESYGELR
jgi:hypothetical protein